MQWLLLAFTFVVMAVLQRLARASGGNDFVEARATLSLGLLLVAAYLGGAIARWLRLPRIVGFLIIGFVAGPAWLGLVRADELRALEPIASGALALIALAAGAQLRLPEILRVRHVAVLRSVAGAVIAPFAAVVLVVLTVSPWFPLTAHQPFRDALVIALVLGTMAAVSSPTLTWALITDVDADGPLPRAALDVSIVQDLAAVLLLVLMLAIAQPLASSGAVMPGAAWRALLLLAGSIAAGAALGLALGEYCRAILGGGRAEILLAVFAFIVSQAVRLLGLDAVLMGLAAGCVLRNTMRVEGDRLTVGLKRCAVPINVVFFALAGCGLRLGALQVLWPWALLLAGLRIAGLRAGLLWAGRNDVVRADFGRYGWMGLISQGGLALTLAALLRRGFPEWNVSLEALLVAMIGVYQIAGPVCFQWALRRTGEGTEETHASQTALVGGGRGWASGV